MDASSSPESKPPLDPSISSEEDKELKKALNLFKKRLKAVQREEDSKLGRSPLTGQKHTITAIRPPPGYTRATWDKLAELGHLRHDGGGFYELSDEHKPS